MSLQTSEGWNLNVLDIIGIVWWTIFLISLPALYLAIFQHGAVPILRGDILLALSILNAGVNLYHEARWRCRSALVGLLMGLLAYWSVQRDPMLLNACHWYVQQVHIWQGWILLPLLWNVSNVIHVLFDKYSDASSCSCSSIGIGRERDMAVDCSAESPC